MRLLLIIVSSDLQNTIVSLLKKAEIMNYTLFDNVLGAGTSGHRFNTPVGPGYNVMILLATTEIKVKEFLELFFSLKNNLTETQGSKIFELELKGIY